jgi:hypothetical protein
MWGGSYKFQGEGKEGFTSESICRQSSGRVLLLETGQGLLNFR